MAEKDTTKKAKKPRANASKGKPYPEFPLTPHKNGRWRKIYRGQPYWFGRVEDGHEAAYEQYQHDWPYIIAGRPVPDRQTGNVPGITTVADVLNAFVESKRQLMDNGELSPRTFADNIRTGELIVQAIDRNRDIETIDQNDFARLRQVLASGRALTALGVWITRCRSVFKFAIDTGMREKALRYGQSFAQPKAKAVRRQKASNPDRFFTAAQCQSLIKNAAPPLDAMILLGLNAGLGNNDIGLLEMSHIDLDAGIVAMPRPKTGAPRRAVLWPETVAAVRRAIEHRPMPQQDAEGIVFVTKYGKP